jgi:hypothetical protein
MWWILTRSVRLRARSVARDGFTAGNEPPGGCPRVSLICAVCKPSDVGSDRRTQWYGFVPCLLLIRPGRDPLGLCDVIQGAGRITVGLRNRARVASSAASGKICELAAQCDAVGDLLQGGLELAPLIGGTLSARPHDERFHSQVHLRVMPSPGTVPRVLDDVNVPRHEAQEWPVAGSPTSRLARRHDRCRS